VRIRNQLVPGIEGGFTKHIPSDEVMTIYDGAMRYQEKGTPLVVLAGKEYGSGSSRDWAAKGPYLQGIKAVIAESYERIHRSNLIGMGVLPLQFHTGDSVAALGLTGHEVFEIEGLKELIAGGLSQSRDVRVRARAEDGSTTEFSAVVRIDTPQEVLYYRHGGILQYVLRQLLSGKDELESASGGIAAVSEVADDRKPDSDTVEEGSIESFPASDPPAY
jgi:aconitate hydratase